MLEATLRQAAPRMAYVIADHQNPTGMTMPAADRARIVALARASRTPLVIDETIAGLHFGEDPPPSVATFDLDAETVITLGSMSKAFWAGLRIGWVRATPALVQRLAAVRAALDISSPVLEQLVAVSLLADAPAILERQRHASRRRRDVFVAALRTTLPEWRFTVPTGGLSLWVELDAPRSTALAAIADRYGLRVAAGPRFGVDGAFERFVRLPFSLPEPVLEEAASRLALAWRAVAESPAPAVEPAPSLVA
jgi:DNA-binding transcriptional MocR family regulator